jgi:hypothetical protein
MEKQIMDQQQERKIWLRKIYVQLQFLQSLVVL